MLRQVLIWQLAVLCLIDPVCILSKLVDNPHLCGVALTVVCLREHVNSSILTHLLYLREGFHVSRRIDSEGGTSVSMGERKCWDVGRAVGNVDHVLELDAS